MTTLINLYMDNYDVTTESICNPWHMYMHAAQE